jgi:outer membrane lipoprotein-sorting protein
LRKSLLLLFILTVFCAASLRADSVDDIIAKNIQAHGGMEKLKALQSIRMSGKMTGPQGMEGQFVFTKKRPNQLRVEFTFQGMTGVQAFDGETAWQVMPFMGVKDPQKMTEEETQSMVEQADFDGPLIDYKSKGNTVELVGDEDVEGTPCQKLKLTLKSGDIRDIYLDKETALELKVTAHIKREGREITADTYFGDYKTTDGLTFPFSIEEKVAGQQGAQYTIEKAEVDVSLDDSIFKMPAAPGQPQSAPTEPGR